MKFFFAFIFMFAVSGVTYAQSTCLERCEKHAGVGNRDCPIICEGVDERLKRKKRNNSAEAEAAFRAGAASASASASASIPKNESVDPKEVKPAIDKVQPGKKSE